MSHLILFTTAVSNVRTEYINYDRLPEQFFYVKCK